ncbi:MAG: ribonuclease M5, partial [Enterococcus sp.]|nr:ribonuclease M5 [Enterococcus sp.]
MKQKYPNVIVVEGKMDKDLILSFLEADIITTNGSEVSHETIELIRKVSETRSVVVLTDPDAPGKRIRDILNNHIPGLANAFIPKDKAIKGHKLGVAESDKD